jgi:hypothetical protein
VVEGGGVFDMRQCPGLGRVVHLLQQCMAGFLYPIQQHCPLLLCCPLLLLSCCCHAELVRDVCMHLSCPAGEG